MSPRGRANGRKEAAAELLQAHGVSAMPVMGPLDHHADPHLLERGAIVHLVHPEVGDERHVGNPLRLSRLPQRPAASAPCLGADTEAVLTTVLGLTADEVADLVARGVCRWSGGLHRVAELSFPEAEEAILVGTDLVEVEVVVTRIDVLADAVHEHVGDVGPAGHRFDGVVLGDEFCGLFEVRPGRKVL